MVELDGPLLGIETATNTASLAVLDADGQLLGEWTFSAHRTMAQRLVPALDALLGKIDLTPGELAAVAVGLGPGSFTSLRVGLATAKGILLAADLPAIGVPTLEALAVAAPLPERMPVCAAIAAPKRHLYAATYARRSATETNCLLPPALLEADELARWVRSIGQPVALVGVLPEDVRATLEAAGAEPLTPLYGVPRAAVVAQLGLARLRAGERHEPAALTPLYVRPSEPEERLGRAFARHDGPEANSG